MPSSRYVEVWKTGDRWYWHLCNRAGAIISTPGQGYTRRWTAVRGAARLHGGVPVRARRVVA